MPGHFASVRSPFNPLVCAFLLGLACGGAEGGSRYPGDARETIAQACEDGLASAKRCDSTCHNAQLNALDDCPDYLSPPMDEIAAYAACRRECEPIEECSDGAKVVSCECEMGCLEDASQELLDSLAFSRDCAADVPECEG